MSSTTTRTKALTFTGPLAPRRLWWSRMVLPFLRILAVSSSLARLRFIHFAGWIVFGDLPGAKPPGWRTRPTMIFLSDFDGDQTEYLAAFGLAMPRAMRWSFGSCDEFPGPTPTRALIEYVHRGRQAELLHYSAYPDATVRDIDAALVVAERLDALASAASSLSDEDFQRRYRELLDSLALAPQLRPPGVLPGIWQALRSRPSVAGLTLAVPVGPGKTDEIRASIDKLAAETPSLFATVAGLHFCRLALIDVPGHGPGPHPDHLLFSAWFDGKVDDFIPRVVAELGDRSDAIWTGCRGYPGAGDPAALSRWIGQHRLRHSLFLNARSGVPVQRIRTSLERREQALIALPGLQDLPSDELRRELARLAAPG